MRVFAGALAAAVAVVAAAVGSPVAARRAEPLQARDPAPAAAPAVVQLRPNFFMIAGAGGNIGVQIGDDGVVVVDAGSAANADAVVAAIKALSPRPIRYVINTGPDRRSCRRQRRGVARRRDAVHRRRRPRDLAQLHRWRRVDSLVREGAGADERRVGRGVRRHSRRRLAHRNLPPAAQVHLPERRRHRGAAPARGAQRRRRDGVLPPLGCGRGRRRARHDPVPGDRRRARRQHRRRNRGAQSARGPRHPVSADRVARRGHARHSGPRSRRAISSTSSNTATW